MRTTIEIPDDLFRKAKAQAALEGVRLRDVIERGLRLVLAEPAPLASGRLRLCGWLLCAFLIGFHLRRHYGFLLK